MVNKGKVKQMGMKIEKEDLLVSKLVVLDRNGSLLNHPTDYGLKEMKFNAFSKKEGGITTLHYHYVFHKTY